MKKINSLGPYVPGDFTEEHQRLENYEDLEKNRYKSKGYHKPVEYGFPRYKDEFSVIPEPNNPNKINEDIRTLCEMSKAIYSPTNKNEIIISHHENDMHPIKDTITNFKLARKLHDENLDHNPLPDSICYKKYQEFEKEYQKKLLDEKEKYCTAVGWKEKGYGPTRCTKLKVFRTKNKENGKFIPEAEYAFEKNWRFIRKNKVTPIELAICWDVKPDNPHDEPKPPKHLDGSNGSFGPAVFSFVHTPKDDTTNQIKSDGLGLGSSVFNSFERDELRDQFFQRKKSIDECEHCLRNSAKRARSAHVERSKEKIQTKQERAQSSTRLYNLAKKKESGTCYKLKKCGELNNLINKYKEKFQYKAPKLKDPYKYNNYSVKSLSPPFSFQYKKMQGYPEHWRLGTIYQHSYKPIEMRKQPLLKNVFK